MVCLAGVSATLSHCGCADARCAWKPKRAFGRFPRSVSSKGRRLEDVEEMLKENPFHTPTDEEIFILRDLDRKKRLEERRRNEQLSVQEKKTWASRMSSSSRSVKLDDFIEEAPTATDRRTKKMHGLVSATNAAIAKDRRKEKENMSEFIAKKRDMFLVQMALDTKRAEIRKLEEQASQREEVLPSPALDAVVMDPNWQLAS